MRLEVIVVERSCTECPYCTYEPYYSMSADSGYDCDKAGHRIIDDSDNDGSIIEIPKWCPLKEI